MRKKTKKKIIGKKNKIGKIINNVRKAPSKICIFLNSGEGEQRYAFWRCNIKLFCTPPKSDTTLFLILYRRQVVAGVYTGLRGAA